jgi:hypothetical protein
MSEANVVEKSTVKPVTKNVFFRTVRAVLWSFIGIRKSSGFQEDVASIKPLHVLAVGVVAAFIFVIGLILLVNLVVAS